MTTDRPSLLQSEPERLDVASAPDEPVPARPSTLRRRRRTAAGGAVAALVAVALAVGGGSTQVLGQLSAAPQPVPAGPAPADPAPADPAPADPAPADPAPAGAGSDLVVDGLDTARIVDFTERDGQLVATTNRIQLLTGDEANAYAAARGEEVPVPNDQLLVDDSPRLRDYPVRADAPVTLTIPLSPDPQGEPTTTTLPELRQLLAGRPDGGVHPFELVVEDGVVVAFRMLYQP